MEEDIRPQYPDQVLNDAALELNSKNLGGSESIIKELSKIDKGKKDKKVKFEEPAESDKDGEEDEKLVQKVVDPVKEQRMLEKKILKAYFNQVKFIDTICAVLALLNIYL